MARFKKRRKNALEVMTAGAGSSDEKGGTQPQSLVLHDIRGPGQSDVPQSAASAKQSDDDSRGPGQLHGNILKHSNVFDGNSKQGITETTQVPKRAFGICKMTYYRSTGAPVDRGHTPPCNRTERTKAPVTKGVHESLATQSLPPTIYRHRRPQHLYATRYSTAILIAIAMVLVSLSVVIIAIAIVVVQQHIHHISAHCFWHGEVVCV